MVFRCLPRPITQAEETVLLFVIEGYSSPQIALHLKKSVDTVKHQLTNLFNKTNTGNRIELVNWYRDLLESEAKFIKTAQ